MSKQVMVCGIDCHPGDANCNGYCTGKTNSSPEAMPAMMFARKIVGATTKLREAEQTVAALRAWMNSPEGRAELEQALRDADASVRALEAARVLTWQQLQEPMTI